MEHDCILIEDFQKLRASSGDMLLVLPARTVSRRFSVEAFPPELSTQGPSLRAQQASTLLGFGSC